jgi:F-type H+-transporting ATPase subunit delta
MKASPAAVKPYARALYELARERQQTDAVARDLGAMVELLARDAELRDFFGRPWVSVAAKRAASVEIAARLELSPLVRDFIALVARAGRAPDLDAIATAYRGMADADLGRVRAQVRTRVPLTEGERDAMRSRLASVTGAREVIVEDRVDPSLLGGFVAEIGTYIVDGSLDGQLARIGERIQQA